MKRLLSLMLSVMIVLTSLACVVYAAPSLSISTDKAEYVTGDTITVTLSLPEAVSVTSYSYALEYDNRYVTYVSNGVTSILGNLTITDDFYVDSADNIDAVYVQEYANDVASLSGNIATYTFTAKTKGEASFSISYDYDKYNADGFGGGSVAVEPGKKSVTITNAKYDVIFMNGTTEVQNSKVEMNTAPTAPVEEPTKAADAQYTYSFKGWAKSADATEVIADMNAETITEATTYYAIYDATKNKYSVKITGDNEGSNYAAELDYGTKLGDVDAAKTALGNHKEEDAEGIPFLGWYDGDTEITADTVVTGAVDATPKYEGDTFTVNFINGEETVEIYKLPITKERKVSFKGQEPTKAKDAQYTYTFAGWAKAADATTAEVAKNEEITFAANSQAKDSVVNYYAVYTSTVNPYTVTFNVTYPEGVTGTAGTYTATVNYGTTYDNALKDSKNGETAIVIPSGYKAAYKSGETDVSNTAIVEADTTLTVTFVKNTGGYVASGTVVRPGNGGGSGTTTKPDDNKEDTTTPDDNKEDTTTPDDNKEDTTTPDDTTTPGTSAPVVIEGVEDFADLAGYDWAAPHIDVLVKAGLISGNGTNNYLPDSKFNRGQAAKLLLKLTGAAEAPSDAADVPADAWFAPFIGGAKAAGIMGGDPDGSMRPLDDITRQEMAKMIFFAIGEDAIKALVSDEAAAAFADADDIADWAAEPFKYLAALGIITGYEDGSVKPTANITNAEAAVMVSRAMAILELLNVEEAPAEDTTEETVEETEEDAVVEEEATEEEITEE